MSHKYDPNFVAPKAYARVGQKAVIINTDGKILILKRSDKVSFSGKWDLPGGALEHSEDPSDGIRREIEEEAGIAVNQLKPFSLHSFMHNDDFMVIVGYQCEAASDVVTLSWEHTEYQWMDQEKILKLELTDNARYFVAAYS